MADIISKDRRRARRDAPVRARNVGLPEAVSATSTGFTSPLEQRDLIALVEMFFFAYRDFTGEADAVLEAYGLGRAHHRVLHFVNRQPGIRVADLLEILKITKQSLGRVLRKLVVDHWIDQAPGADDRRERHLTLTATGRRLAAELADLQTRRIELALRDVNAQGLPGAPAAVRQFLSAMITAAERDDALKWIEMAGTAEATEAKEDRPRTEGR